MENVKEESNPHPTRIGASTNFDDIIWSKITQLIKEGGVETRDVIEDFILYYRRVNFAEFLTHIEIFKKTIGLPGSIVECGVFKGVSLVTFTKLVEVYCPGDTLKRVIGFDTFKGVPSLSEQDGAPNESRAKVVGGWNAEEFYPILKRLIDIAQEDSIIPRFKRVELIEGDVCKTVPEYVNKNPGLRISLLHLDLDMYEPTKVALEYLYPLVVSGGIVLLDEYAMDGFPGESAAFDEYFQGQRPILKKFPYISTPGGYFIKHS